MRIVRLNDGAVVWSKTPRTAGTWDGRIGMGLAFRIHAIGPEHYELFAWSPVGPMPMGHFRRWARAAQTAEMIVVTAA